MKGRFLHDVLSQMADDCRLSDEKQRMLWNRILNDGRVDNGSDRTCTVGAKSETGRQEGSGRLVSRNK
ncbi:hypothetical protein [Ruminococcus sp.]|uniref:hypothetical protein n=1 Tax=Ruminococcus sp. TaxID=41978 RepID=UPI003AB59BDF